MTYTEALAMVEELRSRYNDFSAHDKKTIELLYKEVLDKKFVPTTCRDCYRDAYIEIATYLKREKGMKEKCKYRLKNGAVLQDFEKGRIYTNANLTDKIAKKWLEKYPKQRIVFAEIPEEEEEEITE